MGGGAGVGAGAGTSQSLDLPPKHGAIAASIRMLTGRLTQPPRAPRRPASPPLRVQHDFSPRQPFASLYCPRHRQGACCWSLVKEGPKPPGPTGQGLGMETSGDLFSSLSRARWGSPALFKHRLRVLSFDFLFLFSWQNAILSSLSHPK